MSKYTSMSSQELKTSQVLLLTSARLPSLNKFIEGLKKLKPEITFTLATYQELDFNLAGLKNHITIESDGQDVASFDMVYFKSTKGNFEVAGSIAQYLKKRGVPFADQTVLNLPSTSKLCQYVILNDNNIQVPGSLFILPGRLEQSFDKFKKTLGIPFIFKDINGSKGKYNYLISNEQDFTMAVAEARDNNILLIGQVYIPNKQDFRILVFGQKIELVISRSRTNNSTHLNNLSMGGLSKLVNKAFLPPKVCDDSLKAARLLKREVAGVDMVKNSENHKWYCLEVNDSPQIATGSFRSEKREAFVSFMERCLG